MNKDAKKAVARCCSPENPRVLGMRIQAIEEKNETLTTPTTIFYYQKGPSDHPSSFSFSASWEPFSTLYTTGDHQAI